MPFTLLWLLVASWAFLFNSKGVGCFYEVNSIVVMLRHTSSNSKDVDIKDNIIHVESNFFN